MNSANDCVEYYKSDYLNTGEGTLIATVRSGIVPLVNQIVNIRKTDYRVIDVTYSIDFSEQPSHQSMRANVMIRELGPLRLF